MNKSRFLTAFLCFLLPLATEAAVEFLDSAETEEVSFSMGTLYKAHGPQISPDRSLDERVQKYSRRTPQELSLLAAPDAEFFEVCKSLFAAQTLLWSPEFFAALANKNPMERQRITEKLQGLAYLMADTLKAAKVLLEYDVPGVRFVFLGRTPNWVMHAAQITAQEQKTWKDNFTQVNYSGTPDLLVDRLGQVNDVERNLVTPERLKVFEAYLDSLGFQNWGKEKIYIVDMIGKGGSLNSFLRILRHYYTATHRLPMPDFTFMALNQERDEPDFKAKHGDSAEIKWGPRNLHSLLFYKGTSDVTPLRIDMIPLGLGPEAVGKYDSVMKSRWNSGSEFYACQWTQANLDRGFKPGSLFKQIYEELFETEIKALLARSQAQAQGVVCDSCGKGSESLMRCPCKKVRYCNRDCQKAHWLKHKPNCKK